MRLILPLLVFSFIALGGLSLWFSQTSTETDHTWSDTMIRDDEPAPVVDSDAGISPQKTVTYQENQQTISPSKLRERELMMSLPRSLQGTDINGGFAIDDDGHLIISSANRDFFEYFLSAMGEESLDQIKDRMIQLIELQLPSPAKEEAIQLLNNYLDFKGALVNLEQEVGEGLTQYGDSPLDQHRARLDMLSNLRHQYLGDEAASAFYGESEAFDRYMLDKMSLTTNADLSDTERNKALLALMEDAPESIKPRLEEEYQMQKLKMEVSELKAAGADSEAIYQARAKVLGEEAASRLQQVEQARTEWDNKYQAYQSEKARIQNEGLSDDAYQAQVELLQNRYFDSQELRRVQALDRINNG